MKKLLALLLCVSLYAGRGSFDEGGEGAVVQAPAPEASEGHHHHHHDDDGSDGSSAGNGFRVQKTGKNITNSGSKISTLSSSTIHGSNTQSPRNTAAADPFETDQKLLDQQSKLLMAIQLAPDPVAFVEAMPVPLRSDIRNAIENTSLEDFSNRFATLLRLFDSNYAFTDQESVQKVWDSINNRMNRVVSIAYNLARFLRACKDPLTDYNRGVITLEDPVKQFVFRIRIEDLAVVLPSSFIYDLALPRKNFQS